MYLETVQKGLTVKKTLQLHFLFATVTFPEAVFLVMCDTSVNEL